MMSNSNRYTLRDALGEREQAIFRLLADGYLTAKSHSNYFSAAIPGNRQRSPGDWHEAPGPSEANSRYGSQFGIFVQLLRSAVD
jgi:hypothetical protein